MHSYFRQNTRVSTTNLEQQLEKTVGRLVKELVILFVNNYDKIKNILENKTLIQDKGEGDYTYHFDIEIEELIYNHVKESVGEIPLRGEERSYGELKERFLMVDPIDGSTNARRNFPFYGTLIAYVEGETIDDVTAGVVWDIPHMKVYFAKKNKGSYVLNILSKEIKKLDIRHMELKTKYEKIYDITPHSPLDAILKMGKYGKLRHIGTLGLSICLVSEQKLDLAIDLSGRGRMVDVVAPLLILKEAGGHFVLEPNKPVTPHVRVNYIASWDADLLNSIREEIWEYRSQR